MPVAPSAKTAARTCKVDGVLVKSFFASFRPAPMGPAHLVTVDSGTNELTRVHFHDGHFQLGGGNDRIGASSILAAEYTTDGPIILHMHDGRTLVVHNGVVASVTYSV